MASQFNPVAAEFIKRVRRHFPDAELTRIYWSFHFLIGAMTITFAETGRIDSLSDGLCSSSDLDAIYDNMVPFLAAGFRALCHDR